MDSVGLLEGTIAEFSLHGNELCGFIIANLSLIKLANTKFQKAIFHYGVLTLYEKKHVMKFSVIFLGSCPTQCLPLTAHN